MTGKENKAKTAFIVEAWYKQSKWLYLLFPVTVIYYLLISLRQLFYRAGLFKSYRANIPVIVVGNITAGGTGKSPVVIALAKYLNQQGFKPGVISRGYGSNVPSYPFLVKPNNDPKQAGDEPLMIAKSTQLPVMISANRGDSIEQLILAYNCNVIIADDGLQHHALARDIEIVVIDGERLFGNKFLLPMGPLREPLKRLDSVDFQLYNGGNCPQSYHDNYIKNYTAAKPTHSHCYGMQLSPEPLINILSSMPKDSAVVLNKVHAVSGIGNPQRFFNTLKSLGYDIIEHAFDDHHSYQPQDLEFGDDLPVVMTEKDAVKVTAFAKTNYWYLPVTAVIDESFFQRIESRLSSF
ncbi:MAG: tetraacyldisaccharide 4'-kinase [Pseudohongiellaceae bacterium]|jgi:tetraacyldisaccharide 4'-kinase